MRVRPRRIPSIREKLIKIHEDLFTIQDFIIYWEGENEVSTVEKLVLVLEDRRYFRHGGFDAFAIFREFLKMLVRKKHGGASTIDMQFVRTATGYRELTFKRKLYEIFLSSLIQFRYSKLIILRSYLDCAYFGSGLTGINSACRDTYNKSLQSISDQEAAELAAMLVYPKPRQVSKSWEEKIHRRSTYGLSRLRKQKQEFYELPDTR